MTRADQQKARKAEIMFKGLELFVQCGYAGTKTSDIARELKISEGLIFHYFPTKEQLYMELVKIGVDKTDYFSGVITDPYKKLYDIVDDLFCMVRTDRRTAMFFVLVDDAQNNRNTPERVREAAGKVTLVEQSVPVIKTGQESGIFRTGDTFGLTCTFWTALQGIMEGIARNPDMPVPETEWLISILKS
ncbi:MAG: TetR/AcrR family transcriptional regulator [Oscillospiraceae bacterium]|nr:TetR/AcrR family transcriptional regulator [Oscillospiraceae bacterium]